MCENDTVGKKTDVKPAAETSSASGGVSAAGVSKIFILTPEILQTLGLAGYTTTRIPSRNSTETIKLSLPTVQGIQLNAQRKEGLKNVATVGKPLEGNAGNVIVIKKPRRDSSSVEKSDDLGETSKSLISSSTEAEKRLNGEGKEKTVQSAKAKVPADLSSARNKNAARKSGSGNLPSSETRKTNDKKTVETKNVSEIIAPSGTTPSKAKNARRKSNVADLSSSETRKTNDKKAVETKNASEAIAPINHAPAKAKNARRKSNAANSSSSESRESNEENNAETKNESNAIDSAGRTPSKVRNARRKSNAGNSSTSERRESCDKNTIETTNKPEPATPGVRTSKRIAKPKKFDDFVLTEGLLTHGEEPRSRRSSLNSDTAQGKKNESGKAALAKKSEATSLVGENVPKKTIEKQVSKPEKSNNAERQSSSENCFAVPEPPTTVRRKSFDKSPEKRTPNAMVANKILESQEKPPLKKGVEVADSKQPNSETRNSLSSREDGFLVPKSPISAGKKKFHKAQEAPCLIGKSTTVPESPLVEATLTKDMKISASDGKKPEIKSLSTDIVDSAVQVVEKTTTEKVSPSKREKLKKEENFSTGTSERLQEVETSEKQTVQISVSEQETSVSNKNVCIVQTIANTRDESEKSPLVTVEAPKSTAKPEAPQSSDQTEDVSPKTSVTTFSDKKNKARVSKSSSQGSTDNKKEPGDSTLNSSGTLDEEEKIMGTKPDPPRSADRNKVSSGSEISKATSGNEKSEPSDRKSGSTRASVERDKVSASRTVLSESSDKHDLSKVPQRHSPRARRVKQTVNSLKSDSPKSLGIKEDVGGAKSERLKTLAKKRDANSLKPNSSKSLETKEDVSVTEPDPPKSLVKRQEAISSKTEPLKSPEKNGKANSSKSDPVKPVEKNQEEASRSKSHPSKPLEKNQPEPNCSKTEPSKSPEKNEEANSSKSDPSESTNKKKEISISLFDSTRSLDKEQTETISDTSGSPDKEEAILPQFALQKSPDTKEVLDNVRFVTSESSNEKQRPSIIRFASPRSADKKEVSISGFGSPESPNNIEEFNRTNTTSLRSPDKEEVSEFASPNSSAKTIEFIETEPIRSISPGRKQDKGAINLDSPLSPGKIKSIPAEEPTPPLETQVCSELFGNEMEVDATNDSDGEDNHEISLMNETSCYMEIDDFTNADDSSSSPKDIAYNTGGVFASPVEKQVDKELFNIEMDEHRAGHPDNNANTEVPLINDESLRTDDTKVANAAPSNEISTTDAIKENDAISAPPAIEETIESPTPVRTYSRRGRSRKSSILPETPLVSVTDPSMESANNNVDESSTNTPRRKRRVLRNEDMTDGKGLSDGSEDDAEKNEVRTRRRGRPSSVISHGPSRGRLRGRGRNRVELDTEYVPRASSSGKEKAKAEDSENVDDSQPAAPVAETVESPKVGDIECGKCSERMEKKNWAKHNLSKHNNMGWMAGNPAPDWDSNLKQLRSVLAAVLKKKKRTQLTCETCGSGKRSVNGFISHLQFCGKTADERQSLMVTCPICEHVMMPSSLEMHERIHRQEDKAAKEKKKEVETVVAPPTSTRGKRKAAEKAATKISEFTEMVKDDEPATKKRRSKEEMVEFIEKPRRTGKAPSRCKGTWKSDIAKNGKAFCRHQGCTFETDSFEVICNHYSECSFAPRSHWVCKLCLFSSQTEEGVLKHVEAEHSAEGSRDKPDSDFENTDHSSSSDTDSESSDKPITFKKDDRYQSQEYNVKFLDEEIKVDSRWPFTYPPALRWTMEFECKNYRLRLFEDLSPNRMRLLKHEESLEYLPELSVSMKIRLAEARHSKPDRWGHMERFEGTVASGIPTCFAGGPVWAMAWLPIPAPMYNQSAEQFVAISTHSTMDSTYEVGKSYVGKNTIQIWNLGPLDHSKSAATAPFLSYGVAHDKGTIWCMEWCPSGCYEDPILFTSEENTTTKRRMGLLAVACSDGCVHVFSLPFPDELGILEENKNSRLPIYETKPILTLTINTGMYDQSEQNWQCTKLNWCKELGHDTIIAGFSNGHVAMWDLVSKAPLFVTTRGETTFIDAFHHFYAHGHAVSAIQWIPYGGRRFFITSSYDRMTKLWDLEDTSFPVTALKRGIAVDGSWFTHWPAYATSHDDVLTYAHTYVLGLRQPGAKIFPLLPTNSPAYSVTTSDYGNSVGHGTVGGEVVVMFPNHMWTYKDMERLSYKKRWLASTVEIMDFEDETSGTKRKKAPKSYDYMPETYEGCKDRYGLIFRDKLNRAHRHNRHSRSKNPFSDKLKVVNIEQYPFTSANRVSWNPNAWSYLWMCVGYQNGIVRFLNFKAVALEKDLRKLLTSHARTMLKDARTLKSASGENSVASDSTCSRKDS